MWHELLIPSAALCLFVSLPKILLPRWSEWWHGNAYYPKYIEEEFIMQFHYRDLHLSGNPWKPYGVEKIPDEMPEC